MTDDRTTIAARAGLLLDRRQLMAAAGALGLTAGWPSAALAQDAPKQGGTLRLGMAGGSASDSLDPRTYADSIMIQTSAALWNFLVEIDAKGNATPELAESWQAEAGASAWTIKLRDGIKFGSGKVFDADDAIFSLKLHMGETASPAKGLLSQIKDLQKVDARTVKIVLAAGNADLPAVLSDYHLIMVPAGTSDFTKPDGTGAYVLERFEPGVRVVLKRKPVPYWKPGRGNFDAVEIRYIGDAAARTQALVTGQVDAINRLDPKTASLVTRSPNLTTVRARGTGFRYAFVARCDTAPFDNLDVRLGLKYGIDRQKIIDTVFSGYATPGRDHLIGPTDRYFASDVQTTPFDPDKAAFHFKKAGLTKPIELQVSEGAFAGATDAAVLYQEMLAKAGVKLDVKRVSADGYWSNVWLKAPFCAVYWAARPSTDITLSEAFLSTAAWNDTAWKRPDFDKLVTDARAELDDGKRKALYAQAQKMIAEDGGMICFAVSDNLDGYAKTVRGNEPHARFDLVDEKLAEKGWFA
jgi:peptide/nickel transport system substrate-binding protein